jgi:transposase InsO family protein
MSLRLDIKPEYEFEIGHKAGRKHVNADCLSRHIATLRPEPETQNKPRDDTEVELTREVVLSEKQKDSYCKKLIEQIKLGQQTEAVIGDDGLLYHGQTLDEAKLIVPETLILPTIKMHHDKVFAGHQGIKRTRDLLKLHYFWPTLNRDVERYVKECDSCAKFKVGRNPTAPLGQLPETTVPFELTSMDICGPYPETRRGNRYLLTVIDYFTRYPEAIPIPRQDAPTVARALVTEIFSRLDCPQTISSDKGSNFMSELFQMCKLLNIKRINSTSFNPQMQGKVEKFHLGLNQTMSHYVNRYGNDWDEFVNYVLMAHRAVPHSVTKYSPFCLLLGRQMLLPTEDDLTGRKCVDETRNFNGDLIQTHVDTLAERFEEAHAIVRENNKAGREIQKESYDRGTRLFSFQPGDLVYLREITRGK